MKTIFITISRGILARNILRTGIPEKILANKNLRIVIIMLKKRDGPPKYLFNEFERSNVKIEIMEDKKFGKFEKIFNKFIMSKLVFSRSMKIYLLFHAQEYKRQNKIIYFFHWLFFAPLNKFNLIKKFCRKIDNLLFHNNQYAKFFDKYKPDLVFSTNFVAHFEADILKEAKRRKVKTVILPRSWDSLDKFLLNVEPDLFLVQNEIMKKEAREFQAINSSKIRIVGFPQFDIYKDKSIILPKEEYCKSKKFNPSLPILFLGSEGFWSQGDKKTFGEIIDAREKGVLKKCNILVRPHFTMCDKHNYHSLGNFKNVFIDDNYQKVNFFHDRWDPNKKDMKDFANSLFHCNVMVTYWSTIALDAVCFDKPIIGIRYGARFANGKDVTRAIYKTSHYEHVTQTNAISFVDNNKELIEKISYYLKNPNYKKRERQILLDKLCYKIDGKSGERIADIILDMLI